MLPDEPNQNDPVEYVPWWIDFFKESPSLIVVSWADNVYRKAVLRKHAQNRGGTFCECRPSKSPKQFYQWLASECGLFSGRRTSAEIYDMLMDWFLAGHRYLVLDEAQLLSVRQLDVVREFHHRIYDTCHSPRDTRFSSTSFVLSSGTVELADKLDKVTDFWAYCTSWRHDGVQLSKMQRAIRTAIEKRGKPAGR